jgi:hypothetical protein
VSASYWRTCNAVSVDATHVERRLVCGHRQRKPLEFLNDAARKHPERMVGSRFVCEACRRVTSDSGPPEAG